MEIKTHKSINQKLCGIPDLIAEGRSIVSLETTEDMAADEKGLLHGGFVFGLADYAAMLAVNNPFVVLAASECKFIKPCIAGDKLIADAAVSKGSGKKRTVEVTVRRKGSDATVFTGVFSCVILEKHVLDTTPL